MKRSRRTSNAGGVDLLGRVWQRDRECQLKGRLERAGGVGRCDGPLDAAHLLSKRRIRAEHGRDTDLVWRDETAVLSCRKHHNMLDDRMARLPRWRVPAFVEEVAVELGLVWSLDRDYGRMGGEVDAREAAG